MLTKYHTNFKIDCKIIKSGRWYVWTRRMEFSSFNRELHSAVFITMVQTTQGRGLKTSRCAAVQELYESILTAFLSNCYWLKIQA